MNKKLLALAIAGAMAAPMAAQAEATIYGKLHVSVESINNDNSAAEEDSSMAVSSNSSRIGFKGAEDLGGGLKAIWQAESTIGVGSNQNSWSNRNTFVGLAGGFGTAIVGRHDTPYKTLGRKVDLFGDSIGDSRTIINQSGQDARTNNTIAYITPNFNGFSAVLAYVTDVTDNDPELATDNSTNNTTDNTENSAVSVSLNYANGPLFIGVAHQSVSDNNFGTNADDRVSNRVAASYEMGSLKFTGLWESNEAVAGTEDRDFDAWGLGAAFKMGANTIKAQYYFKDETDDYGAVDGDETDASKWAVGFDHSMSKQTTVYAYYARVSNGDASAINISEADGHGDAGPAGDTEAGGDPSAFALGIVHKF